MPADLIRFDRKAWIFLGVLLLLPALGTAFKLHGSSIAVWNQVLPDRRPDAGVLWGTPKGVRSDEWLFFTPMVVSQASSRPSFPLVNPGWGPAQAPLITNAPVRHWSMLVRPQYWGFFLLDLEHAFAFYWNMKAFLLLGGVFLLLMLLTGSNFGVSLLGMAWVFFSGFMQWWYSTPGMLPEVVGCFSLLLVSAHYLALSSRRWVVGVSALVLSLSFLGSVLVLYPPFQVPLLYLGIAILAGSLGPRLATNPPRGDLTFRVCCAASALSVVVVLLALYYRDAKPAIELMSGTIYPGSRMSTGGDIPLAQIFGGFYGFFMSEQVFPQEWDNVCEASNFVLLFPLPMAALLWRAWRGRRVTALEWSLMGYLGVVLTWIALGWPRSLAVASGFGRSPGIRSLLGLGLASIFLCCIFLAKRRVDLPGGIGRRLSVAVSWLILVLLFSLDLARVTVGVATPGRVALVSIVATATGYLLLARRRISCALCILLPNILSHGLVNPLAVGLGPIRDSRLFQQVSRIVDQDPDARWAVYGHFVAVNLFKAAGAHVFNGTNVMPPLEDLRELDPRSVAASTYNRFAHIQLVPTQGSDVSFTLLQAQSLYKIEIDPKSEIWRRLRIRYVALPFAATDREFLEGAALVLALPDEGLWVYRNH